MSKGPEPPLRSNRGGGCLESYEVHTLERGHHVLRLRGPQGVVDQLRIVSPSYRKVRDPSLPGMHSLWGPEPRPSAQARSLVDLLGQVLTLPPPAHVDFAIALDRYKVAVDGVDPNDWMNTEIGDLVSRGKYLYRKPQDEAKLRAVGTILVHRLCDVIERHPTLREIDVIMGVPGHDHLLVSFGSRLSRAVANQRHARFVQCQSLQGFRTPAKELHASIRSDLIAGQFQCSEDLAGSEVLIVDDVFRSGATVAETARAARAAGSSRVVALCAVRTMRS
jgi:pyrimidine operon attenuation protein/uracil phosphoribosyltransferase